MEIVGELMLQKPDTVRGDLALGAVLDRMSLRMVEHLPVVDSLGRVVALASEGDLRRYSRRGIVDLPVGQVARKTRLAHPHDDSIRTLALQLSEAADATVVVDENDRPIGIIGPLEVLKLARNALPGDRVVSDIARRRVLPTVEPDTPAREALKKLVDGVTHVAVADADGVRGGLDYRLLAGRDTETAGALIGRLHRTVRPTTNAIAAVNILAVIPQRCLPVVDEAGHLLALLTCRDVLRALTRHLIATSTRPPPPRR